MDKSLACKLAVYKDLDVDYHYEPEIPSFEKIETPLDAILGEIFAIDPITGFPRGDIAYYLSSDANPTVKQWLESNLLMPRGVVSRNGQYDDDTIAEFARGANESVDDYRSRMVSIYDECQAELDTITNQND